jgi:hypothetical protein
MVLWLNGLKSGDLSPELMELFYCCGDLIILRLR